MHSRIVKKFNTKEELSVTAADFIISKIINSLERKELFSLVLAGGNTPRRTYEIIAQKSKESAIDWNRIHIFWSDERFVSSDNKYSNYNMANATLLSRINIPRENVHEIDTKYDSSEEAADSYINEINEYFEKHYPKEKQPIFDLVLLGMGADGHTASLFPEDMNVTTDTVLVKAVSSKNVYPLGDRITMTLKLINRAESILFLVSGKEKQEIVDRIINSSVKRNLNYPASYVMSETGDTVWYILK